MNREVHVRICEGPGLKCPGLLDYTEGLATRGDPEPCVDVPRGRGEASVGARAGRAIEPLVSRTRKGARCR
jgi:hypothetical protein